MFKIAVWSNNLKEKYLKQMSQLVVDCIDFPDINSFPNINKDGYPGLILNILNN